MYETLATGRIFGLSGFHTFIPLHGSSAPPPQPPSPIRHNEQRLRLRCCRRCRRRCNLRHRRCNLRHRRRCHYHRRTAAFAFAATFSSLYLVDCCLFPPAGAVAAVVFSIVAAVVVTMPLVRERTLDNISTVGIRSCFYVGGGRYNAASQSTMIFLVARNTVRYVLCTQFHTPAGYEVRKKRCLWTGPKDRGRRHTEFFQNFGENDPNDPKNKITYVDGKGRP